MNTPYRLLPALILLGTAALLLAVATHIAPRRAVAAPASPTDWPAFAVVTAPLNQQAPAVSDDYIVWADDRDHPLNDVDLYAYDRATGQVFDLIAAPRSQDEPAISGDWVVYRQGTNIAQQFILQAIRISTRQVITIASGTANPINPAISGDWVVWQDSRNYPAPSGYDIYAYNLSTSQTVTVCTAPGNQFTPRISGTRVVWQDLRNPPAGNGDIYGFDLATRQEFTVTTAPANQLRPDIDGTTVVWQDSRTDPNAADIYGADLTTHQEFPIAVYADSWQSAPRVSGPWVVWDDDRNGLFNKDIFAYHLPTRQEFPVIVDAAAQSAPAIWNGLAAWEDDRNGGPGNLDIYAALAPTVVPTPSPSPTVPTATPTDTSTPPVSPTAPATATPTATITATPAPTCTVSFNDVPPGHTFYEYVQYVACRAIVSGYPCGGSGEPCPGQYYRPNNNTTRGQITKMVVIGSAWPIQTPAVPTFEDVPTTGTFYPYIETAFAHAILSGYPCGTDPNEPCVAPANRPYFRPNNNTTRSQLTKIIVGAKGWGEVTPLTPTFEDVPATNTFYGFVERAVQKAILSGYPCGLDPSEPCVSPGNRPYFRPYNNATRGQLAKILTLALQQP
jgi:beta propeller repeat protein